MWEGIRKKEFSDVAADTALAGIRTILQSVRKPDKLPENTWQTFKDFVDTSSQDELRAVIEQFEWSTYAPDLLNASALIKQLLQGKHLASDALQAQEQYERLFLYVFKLLSQKGPKRLTASECTLQVSLPTLSASDHAELERIKGVLAEIHLRVHLLEEDHARYVQMLAGVQMEVQRLVQAQGISAAVSYIATTPVLEVPPPVQPGSSREKSVASLLATLHEHTWTALCGASGTGKSQLAILAARQLGCRIWLRLRDFTTEQASQSLDMAIRTVASETSQEDVRQWYQRGCKQLAVGSLIVLDDLPKLETDDSLAQRLLLLTQLCQASGLHLLTTSPHFVPSSIRLALSPTNFQMVQHFPLSDEEALEILQAHGAPESSIVLRSVSFINTLAHNHPALFTAIALYLSQRAWDFSDATLDGLFTAEYASEVNDETIARLLHTVEDVPSRELLYCLNFKVGSFALDTVQILANVQPVVERPRERLSALTGLWVQRETGEQMSVSPLVKAIGTGELPTAIRKSCYLAFGEQIASRRQVSAGDVGNAVLYFSSAEDFDRAGTFLIFGLSEFQKLDTTHDPASLTRLWADVALPHQITLSLRLYLRGLQIAIGHTLGKDLTFVVRDFGMLLEQAGPEEAMAVLGAGAYTIHILGGIDFQVACHLIQKMLQIWPHSPLHVESPIEMPDGATAEVFVWFLAGSVDTSEKLSSWLNLLEQLTPEQRTAACNSKVGENGCKHVADGFWLKEAKKQTPNWDSVASLLSELARRSELLGMELLWAGAVRGQIIVRAEYRKDLDSATSLAAAAIARAIDPRARFLILECMGRNYAYAGQRDNGIAWMQRALDCDTLTFEFDRIMVLLDLQRQVGASDAAASLVLAGEAADLAKNGPRDIPALEVVKTLGELSIASWLAGDLPQAFEAWSDMLTRLLELKEDTTAWKALYVAAGHVSGYLTALATMGTPPEETADGYPYEAPDRGMLRNPNPALAANYIPSFDSIILVQAANFAEGVGNDEFAAEWALKAVDATRSTRQYMALAAVSRNAVAHLVADNRFAEALDVELEAAAISVAGICQQRRGIEPFTGEMDLHALLGAKPNDDWRQVDYLTSRDALVPIFLRISTLAQIGSHNIVDMAEEVAALCHQIGQTSAAPEVWNNAAEVIMQTFVHDTPARELLNLSAKFASGNDIPLQILYNIGATMRADISPQEAVVAHLSVMPYLFSNFNLHPSMQRRVFVPFVSTYWNAAFHKKRTAFSAPRLVEHLLNDAEAVPLERRAQRILEIVARGLRVHVPEQVQQWLSKKPQKN